MNSKQCASAFSLVEVLIYMTLVSALMSGTYLIVTTSMQYFRTGDVYQNVQQRAQVGVKKIVAEIANGSQTSLEIGVGPNGAPVGTDSTDWVMFLSPEAPQPLSQPWGYDAMGNLLFEKWVAIYHDVANQAVVRAEYVPPSPSYPVTSAPPPASPDFDADIRTNGSVKQQPIAPGVSELKFSQPYADGTLRIELETQESTGSDPEDRTEVRIRTQIFLNNG